MQNSVRQCLPEQGLRFYMADGAITEFSPDAHRIPPSSDSATRDLWQFLRDNYAVPLITTVLGLGLAIAITKSQPPVFRATATLEIQGLNDNFLDLKDVSPVSPERETAFTSDLQTQLRILQSASLIARVVEQLPPEATPLKTGLSGWSDRLYGGPAATAVSREEQVEAAALNLQVKEARQTRIVDLIYDSGDPTYAAAFVNKLAQQYIDQSIQSRLQISQVTSNWLAGQLAHLKGQLEESENRLRNYTRLSGLVVMAEQHGPAEDKLLQIQSELSKAQENRIAKQARLETVLKAPPASLEAPVGSAMRDHQAKLTDLKRQRADLLTVFTPDFDGVKRLDAQITELESALLGERTAILQSIRNDYNDAMRRESLLEEAYARQVGNVSEQAGSLVEYGMLKREVDSNRRLYESMLQKTSEARVASALQASGARLLDPARRPRRPYKPRLLLNLAWGGMAGLLLGLMVVTGRERVSNSIRLPGQLEAHFGFPELGAVPKLRALPNPNPDDGKEKEMVRLADATASLALMTWNRRWGDRSTTESESFRSILTSILFSEVSGKSPQVIAVTSALPREGKTTLITNLAAALARMKRKVLLIDADTQTSRLHETFGQPVNQLLYDLVSLPGNSGSMKYIVQETALPGVSLLALASRDASAVDLLPELATLLNRAREEFEIVLIDTVSLRDFADARVLARMADGVVLVVRASSTSREVVTATLKRLQQDGSRLLGTVLNCWVQ